MKTSAPGRLVFLAGLVAGWAGALLAACGADVRIGDPGDGEWRGEIASYVVDGRTGSHVEHQLRTADGSLRPLSFAADVTPASGSQVRLFGRAEGDVIHVVRQEIDAAAETAREARSAALIDGTKKPTRRWAFVLVDVDGGGNAVNPAHAQDVLFGAGRPDSIRSYFREVSYGLQDLEGEVIGPLPYAMGGRCDTDQLARTLLPQVNAKTSGSFDQYLWFFGTRQAACDWAGIAELGKAERPTKHSWYNSANSCAVLVQEPGHNFGMVHSSEVHCSMAGKPVPIAWPGQPDITCSNEEYGNIFDPMGGGDCYHMNGIQKAYQDWLGGCNVVKASESGRFTIYPLESTCDGPQLLQIPFPQARTLGKAGVLTGYYLELRAPLGFRDQSLAPQVLVMVGNDVRDAKLTGNRNWLLDMKPETPDADDAALVVGQPFEDALPGGPKFTVISADATKAVIEVEIAGSSADLTQPGHGICGDDRKFDPAIATRCVTPATPAAPAPRGDAAAPPGSDAGGVGGAGGSSTPATPTPGGSGADAEAPDGGAGGSGGGAAPSSSGPGAPAGSASSSGCAVAGVPRRTEGGGLALAIVALASGLTCVRRRSARETSP